MTTTASSLDQKSVHVIKGLIMDTVRAANSGHPGGAMSSADFAYVLFKDFLNFDPADSKWFKRDRFVLSAGHESALLYVLLTMRGILTFDDLKAFRQFGSKTPGHPEQDMTDGVEATTGPLGQGFAMAGGMAAAESFLSAYLDDATAGHFTYVLASDGDIQEPICLGSAALFGQWGWAGLSCTMTATRSSWPVPPVGSTMSTTGHFSKACTGTCWRSTGMITNRSGQPSKLHTPRQADPR